MAVYSPGRRRAILLLVLTSLLLITIDLRGNALLDAARDGFDRAMRPFEDAAEVVARPVRNAWRGITEYDDLEAENERLEAQIDAMRTNDIAARSVIEQWQRLLAMFDLESAGGLRPRGRLGDRAEPEQPRPDHRDRQGQRATASASACPWSTRPAA